MNEIFDKTRASYTRNENDLTNIVDTLKDLQKKI